MEHRATANGEIPAVSPAREHPIAPNTDETHRTTKRGHPHLTHSHPTSSTAADARSPWGEDKVPQPTITTTADARLSMAKKKDRVRRPKTALVSVNLLPVPSGVVQHL